MQSCGPGMGRSSFWLLIVSFSFGGVLSSRQSRLGGGGVVGLCGVEV